MSLLFPIFHFLNPISHILRAHIKKNHKYNRPFENMPKFSKFKYDVILVHFLFWHIKSEDTLIYDCTCLYNGDVYQADFLHTLTDYRLISIDYQYINIFTGYFIRLHYIIYNRLLIKLLTVAEWRNQTHVNIRLIDLAYFTKLRFYILVI